MHTKPWLVMLLATAVVGSPLNAQPTAANDGVIDNRQWFALQPRHLYGCGINWADWQWAGKRTMWRHDAHAMQLIKDMGGTSVPVNIPWINVEPEPDQWNFEYVDHQIAGAHKRGLAMFAYMGLTPDWALPPEAPDKPGIGYRFPPPDEHRDDFIEYCTKVAERYRGRVKYYQFWNEQNGCGWVKEGCANGGEYALYARWLKIWYMTMKAVDPECVLAIGGLDYHEGVPGHKYIEGLYNEGCRDSFDAISIHPYGLDTPLHLKAIEDTRQLMVQNGDAHKGIWVSEYGWALEDEAEKSRRLLQVLTQLNDPKYYYVTMGSYLLLTDPGGKVPFGLCDKYLEPRPSYSAFQDFVERQRRGEPKVVRKCIDIAPAWSGHPVGFSLLTHNDRQYVAFYDAERRMTVGMRKLDGDKWQFENLPETVGWDSHNYVTIAIDRQGFLHTSGNMHGNPLVYFRSTRPHDISSFIREASMVGKDEDRVTYPHFMLGTDDALIFSYRDGGSGNGVRYLNIFDESARAWKRLINTPLFSGEGEMNAYYVGPERDRDGVYHICWVWRDTPDCATNHDLSYARSKDLTRWETSVGTPIDLPITIRRGEIVDPVPAGGGIINGNTRIGFDAEDRVIISYHKYDQDGNTQCYSARREEDGWKIYQTSDWSYRWAFKGGGAIPFEIALQPVRPGPDGCLMQSFSHRKEGGGIWKLDPDTLKPVGTIPTDVILPDEITKRRSDRPDMGVRVRWDLTQRRAFEPQYLLRWETLDANRDQPRSGPPPEPTLLQVCEIGIQP